MMLSDRFPSSEARVEARSSRSGTPLRAASAFAKGETAASDENAKVEERRQRSGATEAIVLKIMFGVILWQCRGTDYLSRHTSCFILLR